MTTLASLQPLLPSLYWLLCIMKSPINLELNFSYIYACINAYMYCMPLIIYIHKLVMQFKTAVYNVMRKL